MNSAAKSDLVGKIARALERAGLSRGESLANGAESYADRGESQSAAEAILLALSGGPDSVALLHGLRALAPRFGYRLAVAHLNHRLRGAESDRDEAFVRDLCSTLGVELVVEQANNLDPAPDPAGPNLEERSREARYAFLAAAARRLGASRIATAHHADDQAETVMLRLLRGAGAAGLGAMAETATLAPGGLTILRPMLHASRHEILRYLDSIGARFVSDSSNTNRVFLRNRVRAELLPALERDFAPGLRRRLAALAGEMRELDDYVGLAARTELGQRLREKVPGGPLDLLDLNGFAGLHPALATAVLREFLATRIGSLRRLTRRHIDALRRLCLEASPSATFDLPDGWRAERRYAAVTLKRHFEGGGAGRRASAAARFAIPLAREGVTKVPQVGFVFRSVVMPADAAPMPVGLHEACFDADRASAGLVVRNFASGDRVSPLGMEGSRKVHDIFVDRKLLRSRRQSFPVVTLEGRIAWLPGMVRGRIALVGPETVRVLRLHAFEDAVRE
ncbi:MAG TPA: tRNA lysidine(34) synthetase TilS [Candidatus Binataceae bacterium]|nr:tRNA lysidine(34) synthetase TilS [Candidatus Binataceae bacterium]